MWALPNLAGDIIWNQNLYSNESGNGASVLISCEDDWFTAQQIIS